MAKNAIEIPQNRSCDRQLDKLADEMGFTSKNVMLRFVANELSRCRRRYFFKAVASFSEMCRRR